LVPSRTHLHLTPTQSLKSTTKDLLYEQFRTEKLLARRATASISDVERKKLIDGALHHSFEESLGEREKLIELGALV